MVTTTSLTPKRKKGTARVQVILPSGLAERVRSTVPVRERSAFIASAVEAAMAREEQIARQQREPKAAIWADDDYPYLNTPDDIREWREAIWSGQDPAAVLRDKYAKRGVTTKRDFATWLKTWRTTDDAEAAFREVKSTKTSTPAKRRHSA